MDTFQTILLFVFAIVFFVIFNKMFRITYFGLKGMATVFIICLLISAAVVNWGFTFIANHYGWFIAAVAVILILVALGKRGSQSDETKSNEHSS
ncbi:hypothetical protein [Paenibacillus chitinolyticus]|uniref:hypothetical protein n=1 Tax=Paenibacillus chitinolyticus TaxID=79263 RepID=UPI0004121F80